MLQFLTLLADQAATSGWSRADQLTLWNVIFAGIAAGSALLAWLASRESAKFSRRIVERTEESEKPNLTLESITLDASAINHTVIVQCTLANRSKLPDAVMTAEVQLQGTETKAYVEGGIFICNRLGESFQPSHGNLKTMPHTYPVSLDGLSSVTFKFWFFAEYLWANKLYRPDVGPITLTFTMTTLHGKKLVKQMIYAEVQDKILGK